MKATFIYLFMFIYILAFQVFGAEDSKKEVGQAEASAIKKETPQEIDRDITDWIMLSNTPTRPEIPPYLFAKLTKLFKAMEDRSNDNMPVDVFLIERALLEGMIVNSGFWAKSAAKTVTALHSYVPVLSGSFLLRSVPLPVLSTYADKVTRGDAENFPTLTLKYFVDLLDREKISDRKTFTMMPASKRSFDFETEEFNGVGKGYKGRLVLMDFVYGSPLETIGGINGVISQYGDKALDHLVSVKEIKTPIESIKIFFGESSPAEFAKVGQVWKNSGLHTCTLYTLNVSAFCIYVLGMRIPEKEYIDTVGLWKEVIRHYQESSAKSTTETKNINDES